MEFNVFFFYSAWSEEGCRVEGTNATHTVCECDHLTNFAILMDVHMTSLSARHQTALQIITYVGCSISIICLILAIITFHSFKNLKVTLRVFLNEPLSSLFFFFCFSVIEQQFIRTYASAY